MAAMGKNLTQSRKGAEAAEKLRLEDACELNMGQSPESGTYNSAADGLPFYQGNADFGEKYPTPRVWCDSPVKIADAGDILVSVRAPIGALNFANERCCIGRGLAALRVKRGYDALFVYFALKSKVDDLNLRGTGSTFKAINKRELGATLIPEITLPEQKRIAATLDRICELKKNAETRLAKLDLIVKSRFVEMFGEFGANLNLDMSELANRIKVAFVGTCAKYYTDSTNGVPMVRTTNITEHGLDLSDLKYVTHDFHKKNVKSQLHTGDLLIARFGSNGLSCLYSGGEANCLNAIIIEPNKTRVMPLFLSYLINSQYVQKQISSYLVGSTFAILNTKSLAKLRVCLPPLALQREFAAFVEKVEKLKEIAKRSAEQMDVLYRSKLQEYFG